MGDAGRILASPRRSSRSGEAGGLRTRMVLPTAALFSLLGAAAAAAVSPAPAPVPVPPSGPNFTLAVGVQCLTASGAGERALLGLSPCGREPAALQLWRSNPAGMLFMTTRKPLVPKPTWPGTLCAKPIGDCNRTTGCGAWLGDECVIPAHILAFSGGGGAGRGQIKLPVTCNLSIGHTCLGPSGSSVSLAPCSAPSSAGWVKKYYVTDSMQANIVNGM